MLGHLRQLKFKYITYISSLVTGTAFTNGFSGGFK